MAILMPISAQIHYKCAFNIEKDENINNEVRCIIRDWCYQRRDFVQSPDDSILKNWFFVGDTDQHCFGNCHIRTACNFGIYTKKNPEHWCFELIHQDSDFQNRLWAINITTSRIASNEIRFACILSHALRHNYIGNELHPPLPTVPFFIKKIISNNEFICRKDISRILHRHLDAGVVGGRGLANLICNGERFLPYIVLVNTKDDVLYSDLAEEIQKKNMGNANIYVITDSTTLKEFNEHVPYDHKISDGMVRVFLKYKEYSGSGKYHRFYTYSQIAERKQEIIDEITGALSRRAMTFLPSEIISIKDVIDKRRITHLEYLKSKEHFDKDKYILLLENELEEKLKEISEKEESHRYSENELEDLLLKTQIDLDEALEDKKRLSWEASQYAVNRCKISELESKLEGRLIFFDLPKNLEEVLNNAVLLYSSVLSCHDNALKSARNYKFKTDQKILNEAWKMLSSLAQYMHPAKYNDNIVDLENFFYEKTLIGFSMTESATTKADSKFVKLRTCTHEEGKIEFFPHLKSSVRTEFRIHFAFIESKKQILICHCGHHIDNAKTRHMC